MITACVTMGSGVFIAFLFGWKLAVLLIFGVPFIAGAAYQQNMILKKSQFRDSRLMEIAGKVNTKETFKFLTNDQIIKL